MNFKTPFIVLRSLVYLLITVLVVLFALRNNAPTTLHFLMSTQWTAPLSVVMLLSLLLGVLLGFSLGGISLFRIMRSREKKLKLKQEKEHERLEAQHKAAAHSAKKPAEVNHSPSSVVPLLPNA